MAAGRVVHISKGLWSAVSVEDKAAKVTCGLAGWCNPFCVSLEEGKQVLFFPRSVTDTFKENYEPSDNTFEDPVFGTAKFYNIFKDGCRFKDVAWYFPDPKPEYTEIKDCITFLVKSRGDINQVKVGPDNGVTIHQDWYG